MAWSRKKRKEMRARQNAAKATSCAATPVPQYQQQYAARLAEAEATFLGYRWDIIDDPETTSELAVRLLRQVVEQIVKAWEADVGDDTSRRYLQLDLAESQPRLVRETQGFTDLELRVGELELHEAPQAARPWRR